MIQHAADRRTRAERERDAAVERDIEAGRFSRLSPAERRRSRARARLKKAARQGAERLGLDIAELRRAAGLTQAQLASLIGTQRTDVSRLESGRYGGLTVERLSAVLLAIQSASGKSWGEVLDSLRGEPAYEFDSVEDTVASSTGESGRT